LIFCLKFIFQEEKCAGILNLNL